MNFLTFLKSKLIVSPLYFCNISSSLSLDRSAEICGSIWRYPAAPNAALYLDAAGRKFDQPTHYARKIMLLGELYDDSTLDRFIGYCITLDKMDITSFKGLLKEYNAGNLTLPEVSLEDVGAVCSKGYRDDDPALMRDCSYYETNAMLSEVQR